MAYDGDGEYLPGEWCTFCKVSVKCRARAEEKMKLARLEFKMPPLLTDAEIEEVLDVLPDLTKWANEITAYAKPGMNPKTLQYLMGHSDISVTMNVYTHIGFDDAEEELKRIEEFRKARAEVEQKKEKPMSQKMFKVI